MRFRDKVKSESLHKSGEKRRPQWGKDVEPTGSAVPEGTLIEFSGEFVTQRQFRFDGEVVCRVSIRADDGELYDVVLPATESDRWFGLLTGDRYTVTGPLARAPRTLERTEQTCPECAGRLREAGLADDYDHLPQAIEELGVGDRFVVCEGIRRTADGDGDVDDWVSRNDRSRRSTPHGYVCVDCERRVDEYDVDGSGRDAHFSADNQMSQLSHSAAPTDASMGLAVGGSRNAQNFRENVHEGYVPQVDALASEGLFYDYTFPTADEDSTTDERTDALFTPTYACAASRNPVTDEDEQYLSVGLDSSLAVDEFERPALDLVAVLDVSGSMSSPFRDYYYDATGTKRSVDEADRSTEQTKMDAAAESLCALTEQLAADDRLGVVLFDRSAHTAKPLRDVGRTDMAAIRQHIREVRAGGGTNMEAGFQRARRLLEDDDTTDRERRIVFTTDAMPNTGETRGDSLSELVDSAADDGIYTTFVGMGLDENETLMRELSSVRGANHYFVHSATEFERRLGAEFDYMVSPLVFDLSLTVDAEGYEVDGVYGVPDTDATNEVMNVTTLFPSPTSDGESRGGVILVRLRQTDETADTVRLDVSWDEGDGRTQRNRVDVALPDAPHYDTVGVRKAVALTRYGRVLREWAAWARDEREPGTEAAEIDDWKPSDTRRRTEHERRSVPIRLSEPYIEQFRTLRAFLADEMGAVDDDSLARELDVLDDLLSRAENEVRSQ